MNKKIIILIIMIIIILIAGIIVYTITREPQNTEETINQEESTQVETNNVITAEIEEIEEPVVKEDWQWSKDTPENHNLDSSVLSSLHTSFNSGPVNGFAVIKNDYIVDEYYKSGYDQNSLFSLQSCSKSVTSALVGIAIDKGYIENVDVLISNYFPEIANSSNQSLKQITIKHLLTNTSGLRSTDSQYWNEWRASDNWIDYVLNAPMSSTPGQTFDYSTGNTHLLSAIIQKATGKTAYDFGKEYLFDPIGMDSVECGTDAQGISDGGNGFSMTLYDMAKFGRLYLNNGNWEGEQIISSQWVQQSTTTQFVRPSGSANYGYQWWVRTFGNRNYNGYFAQGHWGQFIFVVPELELIVVFTSHNTGNSNIYWQYVNNIVNACS